MNTVIIEKRKHIDYIRIYCSLNNLPVPIKRKMDAFVYSEYTRPGSQLYEGSKEYFVPKIKKPKRKKKEKVNRKKEYKDYLKSSKWITFRNNLKTIRGNFCENCKAQTEKLDGHHLTYKRLFNELPEDILLLCRPCHKKVHNKEF